MDRRRDHVRISLEDEQREALGGGWLQERYHSGEGDTVAGFLSFRSVYEINPFEVGANHAAERAVYSARLAIVERAMDIAPLRRRSVQSLSNGELRRVILAKTLRRADGTVHIDGGCGGFDPEWRRRIREANSAMRGFGVRLAVASAVRNAAKSPAARTGRKRPAAGAARRPVVEISGLSVAFGNRTLFRDFEWTIREGERWILRGPNGSGKTTLLALISGDAPLAYACDIKVFGRRRGEAGTTLGQMRRRIGEVSSARQAYLGISPEEQLRTALRPGTRLLLLDEPCCDMSPEESERFARRVAEWLDAHPRVAAVWVEHRMERIPSGFSLVKDVAP